jgi:predicted transcriptional regulator
MTPSNRLQTVAPGQCLTDVLRLMAEHDVNQLPVVRGRDLVGMLDRSDVMRFIQVRRELGEPAAEADLASRRDEQSGAPHLAPRG